MKSRILSLVAVMVALFGLATAIPNTPFALAQSPTPAYLDLVAQTGGSLNAVAVQGNYAYVGEGDHLTILDVSDRTKPTFVGKTSALTNALVSEVVVANGYAYVTAKDDSNLYIVDVHQVSKPTMVSSIFLEQPISGYSRTFPLFIKSNILYVGIDAKLALFDLTNPTQPVQLALLNTNFNSSYTFFRGIVVSGTTAYMIDSGDTLIIIDVSNPQAPSMISQFAVDNFYNSKGDIFVANNIVYVAMAYFSSDSINCSGNFTIIDVTASAQPKKLAGISGCFDSVQLFGNLAYVDSTVFDVSDPTNPFKTGELDQAVGGLQLSGNTLYGISMFGHPRYGGVNMHIPNSLLTIDLSTPTTPKIAGSYKPLHPETMQLVGNLAYVSNSTDFTVYDLTNLTNPTPLGVLTSTDELIADFHVFNKTAYLNKLNNYCNTVDVSNPLSLTVLSSTCFIYNGQVRHVANNIAYLSGYNGVDYLLYLFNVSTPSNPIQTGSYTVTGYTDVKAVQVTNNRAYVSVVSYPSDFAMLILDVSNPAAPTKLGEYKTSAVINQIRVVGNVAYLLQDDKLRLVDIANPNNPVSLGVFAIEMPPSSWYGDSDLEVSNNVAYISGYFNTNSSKEYLGLIAIDVNNGNLPTKIDSYNINSNSIEIQGNNIYVGGDYGLHVFNLKPGTKPTPTPTATAVVSVTPSPTDTPTPTATPTLAPNISLQLSPSKLTFEATEGQSNPAAKPLNVAHVGTGSVSWSASSNAAWLTVSQATGTTTNTVNVSVNTTGLKAATYNGQITISANGAKNSPQTVEVSLVVNPAPASSERFIDLSISLYKSAPTATDRAPYERIMEYFADAIYEMSNGAHKVRNVTIYPNGAFKDKADIVWNASEWPRVRTTTSINSQGGVSSSRLLIMGDVFNSHNFVGNEPECGGYTLGHEWGHYYYGLYDEYALVTGDIKVNNSVMNDPWQACFNHNFNWLNFSIAKNQTFKNAQYRNYAASGWETLTRPTSADPRDGERYALPLRPYYPELTKVAPSGDSSIELPAAQTKARSHLKVTWQSSNRNLKQNNSAYQASINSILGNEISYPQPVMLVASVTKDVDTIAKVGLKVEVTGPDGNITSAILADNGVAPDIRANDGVYSGFMAYKQNGAYAVKVIFDNVAGTAESTQDASEHTPDSDGNINYPAPVPITETFTASAFTNLLISGVKADDYGDTTATATMLPLDNSSLAGQIDRANDVDMFQIVPTATGQIALRVSNLALGMKPQVRVFKADGTTVLMEGNLTTNAHANGYLLLNLSAQANQKLYVTVSHTEATATQGLYDISAGAPLVNEQSAKSNTYLPLIIK